MIDRYLDSLHADWEPLPSPDDIRFRLPRPDAVGARVAAHRQCIRDIVHQRDPRLMVVIGPCSVHDHEATVEYAHWLAGRQREHAETLLLVMRCYVEKPRTRLGWKGMLMDAALDGSASVAEGLVAARRLMLAVTATGLPVATELVNPATCAYLGDLLSWAAVGARTTESPVHRHLASACPCPVGFKNPTSGLIEGAVDAIAVAATSHRMIGTAPDGGTAVLTSRGNPDCHLVLRGGRSGANHHPESLHQAAATLADRGVSTGIMVDCGHGNGGMCSRGQSEVATAVAGQLAAGAEAVIGVMIESNLVAGRQPLVEGVKPDPRISLTDPCLGLEESAQVLELLSDAVASRLHAVHESGAE
jgi:3-deoxy-7-phosphoheptulonate synthase